MKKILIILLIFTSCSDEELIKKTDLTEDNCLVKYDESFKDECRCLYILDGDIGLEGSYTFYNKVTYYDYLSYLDSVKCNLIVKKHDFEVIKKDVIIGDYTLKCDC
ncbi:MAG: hypothetical protein JXQ96_14830 [Cyclobacteriaceae bacterium]